MTVQFLFIGCKQQSTGGTLQVEAAAAVWTELRQCSGRMAAMRNTLPCCASAAFDDNSSIMTMHFLFFGCERQSVGGTGRSCSSCLNKFSVKAVQRETGGNSSRYAIVCRKLLWDQAGQLDRRDN